ncbi:MAG: hypothetical protein CSA74_01365 [Rhodobacterales bacterium]|nr:MAG: hypothetical protein CSA74_01365 [Rhodobacterales bacterium]
MPAATTKADLLSVTRKEYDKLVKVIDRIPDALAMVRDADDTSVKDVIAHRAHWIGLFLGWYADGQAGREVHFPAEGYTWGDLKRYNADLRARQAGMGWEAAKAALAEAHATLESFIEAHDEAALYGGPMKGGRNAWTTGRWAEASGPSPYRSAAKYLRARLRTG